MISIESRVLCTTHEGPSFFSEVQNPFPCSKKRLRELYKQPWSYSAEKNVSITTTYNSSQVIDGFLKSPISACQAKVIRV